ncbi:MAG: hypothetical protein HUU49_04985 [Candidatus Buchananbacteria bacterium]|nr:hypothetical protein [Candidatus Buchananbacteria bacterium]
MQLTDHHMIPRSRLGPERRNTLGRRNIKRVQWQYHDAWHCLFLNMTPYEAVICIIERLAPPDYFSNVRLKAVWGGAEYEYSLRAEREPILMIDHYRTKKDCDRFLKTLFAGKDWPAIISEVVTSWSPEGYWQTAVVRTHQRGRRSSFMYQNQEAVSA